MSGYKGPRGPNVSQYIANLNQLSPPAHNLAEPQPVNDDFSAFLNTDFFDINGGTNVNLNSPIDFGVDFDIKPSPQPTAENSPRHSISAPSAKPNMEFNLNGDFQFTDFSNFNTAPILDASMPGLPQPPQSHYPLPTTYAQPNAMSPIDYDDLTPKKRKVDDLSVDTPIEHMDEHARVAAEEDKRRRNTAASARFRVKKKQREQALEKTAKDMSDRVQQLEARIGQLETENTWLKSLITEKNVGKSSTSDLKAMLSEHEKQKAGRSSPAHTEGVGTKA
ncbi:uncharacterized protein M421DRAFT_68440 [Didymella exigua CBS 183.55]|uniref:BZIP domain-containing protein n=1 Tax=Didymella exigua CBS 183.55 TaxID=1150837 RepID=A0A6A5RCT7_9PLEO|nr:uncharacterized protein M421DRAFT_68440 [Didymella exigua CBS 183.55]KAF1926065.1 hypothetical protein M421DRAFT_68440 [Didymella exigua CBS 183.55]